MLVINFLRIYRGMSVEGALLPSADGGVRAILTAKLGGLQSFVLARETLIHFRGKETRWNLSSVDDRLLLMMVSDAKESSATIKEFKGSPNAPAAIHIHHLKDPSGKDLCHVVRLESWMSPPVRTLATVKGRLCIEARFTGMPPVFDAQARVQGGVFQIVECSPVEIPLPIPLRIVTMSYSGQDRALMFQSTVGGAGRSGAHDFVILGREGNVVVNVTNITPALSPLDRYHVEVASQVSPSEPLLHILATLSTFDPLRITAQGTRSVGYSGPV